MKKLIIILLSFICLQVVSCAVQDNRTLTSVAIITDHILDPPLVYYNYPASSELFANEFVNELRLRNNVKIVAPSDVKEILSLSTLTHQIKSFETQYRTNFIIDFTKLRDFAKLLGVDNILLVTSNIDSQSYFLKGTLWNVLNLSGMDVVNPVYQVITNVALIDVKSETIIWQNLYRKNLKAKDNSIIPATFAPYNQQLKAVSDYSKALSYQVANSVEEHICPYLYFDALGNKYNRKSNSIIGKTKYYTKNVYDKYVDVDVPGANLRERHEKYKENKAVKAQVRKQERQEKAEKQKTQLNTETKKIYNDVKTNKETEINEKNMTSEIYDNVNYEQEKIIERNPMREYYQNDSLQLKPSRTPDAYGNYVDDL